MTLDLQRFGLERCVVMGKTWLSILLLILAGTGCGSYNHDVTTVILVRHADRHGDSDQLSPNGVARVQELQRVLSGVEIDVVYSTDFLRTRSTVEPIATNRNLQLLLYNPEDLMAFADKIKQEHLGQTILVSGHSNTTPQLINRLGVQPPLQDLDRQAYDRLFLVTFTLTTEPRLLTLQFGADTP